MSSHRIVSVEAMEVYSDRMKPAVSVVVKTENGGVGKSIISEGLSVGSHESPFLFDNNNRFFGRGVSKAVENVNRILGPAVLGMDSGSQRLCDEIILSFGKEKMGANATSALSTAILFAGANSLDIPLYEHIGGVRAITLPVPAALAISGSNRYGNSVMCGYKPTYCFVAYDFPSYREASYALWEVYMNWSDMMKDRLSIKMQPIAGMAIPKNKVENDFILWDMLSETIEKSGYMGKIGIQVDMAANCFYNPDLKQYEGLFRTEPISRTEMIDTVIKMSRNYPFVIIEDPLEDNDFEGFAEITSKTDIQITGDDLIATDMKRLKKAIQMKAGNATRIVTSQIGTVSEAFDVALFAQEHNFGIVPCGERGEGLAACDYAVGLNAGSAHELGMCYSGNRLLEIEEELGHRAKFLGKYGIRGKRFEL